jgi:hypothetical protein
VCSPAWNSPSAVSLLRNRYIHSELETCVACRWKRCVLRLLRNQSGTLGPPCVNTMMSFCSSHTRCVLGAPVPRASRTAHHVDRIVRQTGC